MAYFPGDQGSFSDWPTPLSQWCLGGGEGAGHLRNYGVHQEASVGNGASQGFQSRAPQDPAQSREASDRKPVATPGAGLPPGSCLALVWAHIRPSIAWPGHHAGCSPSLVCRLRGSLRLLGRGAIRDPRALPVTSNTPPPSPTCGSHTDRLPAPRNTRVLLPCGLRLTSSSSHSARAGLVSTFPPPSSGGPQQQRARGVAPCQVWLHTDRLAAFLGRCR